MDIMIIECVPSQLRGELSRWMTPVWGGVHVGRVSALVRDHLWELSLCKAGKGRVIQIWQCGGDPGYKLRCHGLKDAALVDLEGLQMIAVQDAAWREAMARFPSLSEQSIDKESGDLESCLGFKRQF